MEGREAKEGDIGFCGDGGQKETCRDGPEKGRTEGCRRISYHHIYSKKPSLRCSRLPDFPRVVCTLWDLDTVHGVAGE